MLTRGLGRSQVSLPRGLLYAVIQTPLHYCRMERVNGQVVDQRVCDRHSYVQFKQGRFRMTCSTAVSWGSVERHNEKRTSANNTMGMYSIANVHTRGLSRSAVPSS